MRPVFVTDFDYLGRRPMDAIIRHLLVGVGLRHPAAQFLGGELALEDVTHRFGGPGLNGYTEEG